MEDGADGAFVAFERFAGSIGGEGADADDEVGTKRVDDADERAVARREERRSLFCGELVGCEVSTALFDERERAVVRDEERPKEVLRALEAVARETPQPRPTHFAPFARKALNRTLRVLAARTFDRRLDAEKVTDERDVTERNARLRHAEGSRIHPEKEHLLLPRAVTLEVGLVRESSVGERIVNVLDRAAEAEAPHIVGEVATYLDEWVHASTSDYLHWGVGFHRVDVPCYDCGSMARDPVPPESKGSDSSLRARRFRLLHRGREIPLESGEYTIGRGAGSDVLIDDPLVSRRHARLLVNDTTALLEDLQSENGVFVNEQRVRRSVRLSDGDRILVGTEEIAFLASAEHERPSGPIEVASPSSAPWRVTKKMATAAPSTLEADAFEYLGQIAERMIRMKRGQTAERLLSGHLEEVISAVRASAAVDRDIVDAAAVNALRLALGLREPGWVDYVIELHLALKIPPSAVVTTALRGVVPELGGIDRERWDEYARILVTLTPSMTAAEQALARNFLWI